MNSSFSLIGLVDLTSKMKKKLEDQLKTLETSAKDMSASLSETFSGMPALITTFNDPTALFKEIFKNNQGIISHINDFMVLFITILILSLQTTIDLLKLFGNYAITAAKNKLGFNNTTDDKDIQKDKWFQIFGDYWVNMVMAMYKFLNENARKDFKIMITTAVSSFLTTDDKQKQICQNIDINNNDPNSNFSNLIKDNIKLCVLLPYHYFIKYDSSKPTNDTGSTDESNKKENTENVKKLIQNSILLYSKLTGHKTSDTICTEFVKYVNAKMPTEFDAADASLQKQMTPADSSLTASAPPEPADVTSAPAKASSSTNSEQNPNEAGNVYDIYQNTGENIPQPQDKQIAGKRKTKTKTKRRTKKRKTKRR